MLVYLQHLAKFVLSPFVGANNILLLLLLLLLLFYGSIQQLNHAFSPMSMVQSSSWVVLVYSLNSSMLSGVSSGHNHFNAGV